MKVFVGCSSSDDISKKYLYYCKQLLIKIFKNNDLVFGASQTGIMGIAYEEAKKNNQQVIGICPEVYKEDLNNISCDKEVLTKTISDRTDKLINESDLLLFLPGGIGTIYELFTAIESKRNHEFEKPIIIYNCKHYFDDLLVFLDKIYKEKFSNERTKFNYYVYDYDSEDELVNFINYYDSLLKENKRIQRIMQYGCEPEEPKTLIKRTDESLNR